MAWLSEVNNALWKVRTSSGSRRSESDVKPQRSANRTVTCRRSASAGRAVGLIAETCPSADPQRGQKAGEHEPPTGQVHGNGRATRTIAEACGHSRGGRDGVQPADGR